MKSGKWTTLTFPTNTLIAAQTWMPSISVPAGFTGDGIPVGLELVVYPYREPDLFRLRLGFRAATHHRKAPPARRRAEARRERTPIAVVSSSSSAAMRRLRTRPRPPRQEK